MRLVLLFGPPAVGKMAVGLEVEALTGLPLFHNHMSIEPVLPLFEFGSPPFQRIVSQFRQTVFDEVVRSDLPGLIFTYVWDFGAEADAKFVEDLAGRFHGVGGGVHYVELYALLDERLRRNRTELRMREKPSKRNVEASEARLLAWEVMGLRLNTDGDFPWPDRHLRIDTTEMSAAETAARIVDALGLRPREV